MESAIQFLNNWDLIRGNTLRRFMQGGSASRSHPLPYYIPLSTEKVPLFYTFYSIAKWYPFHIPRLELCIPFNYCKYIFFIIWANHKTRTFSLHFFAASAVSPLGPFTYRNVQIPYPFKFFRSLKIGRSLPAQAIIGSKPPPPPPPPPTRDLIKIRNWTAPAGQFSR